MTIGDRIKNRRIQLGLSASDLAKRLNKDRTTVYRYESGYIESMPITVIQPLAKALLTTPEYLMGWEEKFEDKNIKYSIIAVSDNNKKTYYELSKNDFETITSILEKFKI